MSFEEFAEWIPKASAKHEFLRGLVYGMAGGTHAHSVLAAAMTTQLSLHFLPKGCDVLTSDLLVQTPSRSAAFFPDVSVVCGPLDSTQMQATMISNPCIIVEVMSKSTRNYDQGDKLIEYRRIPTLQYYILVDSQQFCMYVYARQANRTWQVIELIERDSVLQLPVYDVSIPLSDIFGRLQFEGTEATD